MGEGGQRNISVFWWYMLREIHNLQQRKRVGLSRLRGQNLKLSPPEGRESRSRCIRWYINHLSQLANNFLHSWSLPCILLNAFLDYLKYNVKLFLFEGLQGWINHIADVLLVIQVFGCLKIFNAVSLKPTSLYTTLNTVLRVNVLVVWNYPVFDMPLHFWIWELPRYDLK